MEFDLTKEIDQCIEIVGKAAFHAVGKIAADGFDSGSLLSNPDWLSPEISRELTEQEAKAVADVALFIEDCARKAVCDLLLKTRLLKEIKKGVLSAQGRNKVNARHNKPGGSRDKVNQMRTIWSEGKYTSRDICAEQECAALDMSFSAARKALRGTPDPA